MVSRVRLGNQEPTFKVVGDYAYTVGDKIVKQFERTGKHYYPCQAEEIRLFAARNSDGRYAAKTISLSKPRQNGKSYGARDYALSMALAGKSVLYSAHNGGTTRKMYKYMSDTVRNSKSLSSRLISETRGKGSEGLYFIGGGCVEFSTRTTSGARGGTYDIIIIDEAQELTY